MYEDQCPLDTTLIVYLDIYVRTSQSLYIQCASYRYGVGAGLYLLSVYYFTTRLCMYNTE